MQLQSARRSAIDCPETIKSWVLIDPTTHLRDPDFGAGVRVGAEGPVTHHQAQADTAGNQAGAFTERDINLRQVATKDWLALTHLHVGFTRHARGKSRHRHFVTTREKPVADLAGALPRRFGELRDARQFTTKEGRVFQAQVRAWLDSSFQFGNTFERIAFTRHGKGCEFPILDLWIGDGDSRGTFGQRNGKVGGRYPGSRYDCSFESCARRQTVTSAESDHDDEACDCNGNKSRSKSTPAIHRRVSPKHEFKRHAGGVRTKAYWGDDLFGGLHYCETFGGFDELQVFAGSKG